MWKTKLGSHGVVMAAIALAASFGTPARAGVQLGLEVGGNFSSLSYKTLAVLPPDLHWDPEWRTSFTGGVSLEFPLRRRVSILTGLRYVQQGNRVQFSTTGPTVTGDFLVVQNYVAVPVLLTLRPLPSRRYFIAAGPEGALLINGKTLADHSSSPGFDSSSSITKALERTNWSVDSEAGVEFPAGHHVGTVALRYTQGLVDAERKQDWIVTWKTRGVEGLVGMRW